MTDIRDELRALHRDNPATYSGDLCNDAADKITALRKIVVRYGAREAMSNAPADLKKHIDEAFETTSSPAVDPVGEVYLVWSHEHGLWWGPNSRGYCVSWKDAGRYTRAEAIAICANARDGWEQNDGRPNEIPVRESDAGACSAMFDATARAWRV